jgi:hypothetical protein
MSPASPVSSKRLFSQLPFLLAGLPDKQPLVLSHTAPCHELLALWKDLLGYVPKILAIPQVTGRICLDALHDSESLRAVAAEISERAVNVRAWGPTLPLAVLLRALGIDAANQWNEGLASLVGLLNSKALNRGFVDYLCVAGNLPFRRFPYACVPDEEAMLSEMAHALLPTFSSLIVKPGNTWGAKGTSAVAAPSEVVDMIKQALSKDVEELSSGYFLLEPNLDPGKKGLSPSIDWVCDYKRAVAGTMVMAGYQCSGTVYGLSSMQGAEAFAAELIQFVEGAATELQLLGYRGWFDTDFLVTPTHCYINEMNIRATGGTVPILVADALFGREWEKQICCITLDGRFTRYGALRDILTVAESEGLNGSVLTDRFVPLAHVNHGDCVQTSFWLSSSDPEKARAAAAAIALKIQP